jgi:hypothetical protein
MASLRDFAWLTLVGIVLLGVGWYAPFIGFGFQVLVGIVGVIFLIVGILGVIDKLGSSD